jgi:multidrug efflux pump
VGSLAFLILGAVLFSRLKASFLKEAMPKLTALQKGLPPGYRCSFGGEYDKQATGFKNLAAFMAISIAGIFLALVFQFNSVVKPLLVFAAAPHGVVGAIAALWIMGVPFGFMAFLRVASLVGVIVSHVIVLFDFIEKRHDTGEPFEEAVIDTGIIRLRPVMMTVGATVLALFPCTAGRCGNHLCYA